MGFVGLDEAPQAATTNTPVATMKNREITDAHQGRGLPHRYADPLTS